MRLGILIDCRFRMSKRRTRGRLPIRGGPGEVTNSRLKDDGMRHRFDVYNIIIQPCIVYDMIDKHTSLYRTWDIFSHFILYYVDPIVFVSARIL